MSYPERQPKCPIRYRAAARFSQTAMNFLLLHELGHIRNGHLHFLPSGAGAMRILAEAESKPPDNRSMLANHTLESDADSHAVVHGVNAIFQLARMTPGSDPLDVLYATPEHTLHAYLLPAYAVLRSLGSPDWSPDTVWQSSHPPLAIRQFLLTQLVSARVARPEFNFASPDRPFEIARDVMMEVEQGFLLLTGVERGLSDFAAAMEYWRRTYGRQITEFWITAHPRLDKLKLGGWLAPPDPWHDGPHDAKVQ
jgi:hypothetical protein